MKIKFLNQTINILASQNVLPYPFYDVNYAFKTVYISSHIALSNTKADREQLSSIILKGCIDLSMRDMSGLGQNNNPVYDYVLSKIDILPEIYDIDEFGNKVNPFVISEEQEVSE